MQSVGMEESSESMPISAETQPLSLGCLKCAVCHIVPEAGVFCNVPVV
ncbi:MAG: hypothetical protein DK304_001021 [Chloroflexi bacterium]|jgi:hypothetical protein|nr:MAG: hypothetical protein DK304_001021 [Chloroflexota bacterium]